MKRYLIGLMVALALMIAAVLPAMAADRTVNRTVVTVKGETVYVCSWYADAFDKSPCLSENLFGPSAVVAHSVE